MRRLLVLMVILASFTAGVTGLSSCSSGGGAGTGGGHGAGGGGQGGGSEGGFAITVLDPNARVATYLAMAVDPVAERVGVAYFTPKGTQTIAPAADGGTTVNDDYELKYVEYTHGVVSTPETLRVMQRLEGLSLAFEPTHKDPVVAYLGGATSFVVGESIFWFQHEAVYARKSGSTWTETVVARNSGDAPAGNNVSDLGFLVGLWPSILFDPAGNFFFVYRDAHNGEFPLQDWGASDVELWNGPWGGSLAPTVLAAGGKDKKGYGGHLQLVMGASQPAVIYDELPTTADGSGQIVWFNERKADGTWKTPQIIYNVYDTGPFGASFAYDGTDGGTEGFGLALGASSHLTYFNRNPANGTWNTPDPFFSIGSGGWYPSLAMDPIYHEPAIAFYVCSTHDGRGATQCLDTENDLRVSQRMGGNWREVVVDTEGGYAPKLGFFASGKRFVVYRTPPGVHQATGQSLENVGIVKIAVER